MSGLASINSNLRLVAIRTLLAHHPHLMETLITEDGDFNVEATPEVLDYDDPGDILVRLAWDIWNGGGETEMDKVLTQLGEEDFLAFVDSMKDYHQVQSKIRFAYTSGSESD